MSNISRLMAMTAYKNVLTLTAGTLISNIGYYESSAGIISPDPFFHENGELRRLFWDGADHHLLFWNSPDVEPSNIIIDGTSFALSGGSTSYTFGAGSQAFFDGVTYRITME